MKNECLEWKLGDEYEKLAFTFKVILHVITHLSEKKNLIIQWNKGKGGLRAGSKR